MKNYNKFLVAVLAIIFVFSLSKSSSVLAATSPVLTGVVNYSVLGASTVTNTGSTTIGGDLGVSPGTAITGFPPGVIGGGTHSNDDNALSAQTDDVATFGTLDQPCNYTYGDGYELSTLSPLVPGVYCSTGSFMLTGNLALTGSSGVWIFKTETTLITASSSSVTGGDPCNVWWRVGSSATLGTTSSFIGNIFALASITFDTGATLNGRALSQTGAVTLDTNTISGPICTSINTFTLTYTAGTNGTITGTTPQTVDYGSDGTLVTAVPNVGYHFTSWDDGVLTLGRTETNVVANHSPTANFAIIPPTQTIGVTSSGSTIIHGCKDPTSLNYSAYSVSNQSLCQYSTQTSITTTFSLSRILRYKMISPDVLKLQQYLNTHGYIIATTGAGSPNNETNYFGPKTYIGVIRFQKDHKLVTDGIVGPKTVKLMK
jgi:hypothetical protein